MIEVKDLVKKYGSHLAVDHLSFTVEKGQVLGFLGPNGAGKTTTMNMLTGYISATEGSVSINGFDIFDEPEEAKKCIGYLPEQPPVYMDMTVEEYLNFVADLKKVSRKEKSQMIDDIMQCVSIDHVKGRLIKHLSKGYRQRVGLAQALVGYPEVIILDEPTVGLDPMQIIEIRDLIKELAKEHTIILSSHILSEVSAICDTVMIINKGKLVVSDTPQMLSKHLKGAQGLDILVKATKAAFIESIATIKAVTKVDYLESDEDFVKATIYSEAGTDIREELFFTLAARKLPIYEMTTKSVSLEDVFLELTKEDHSFDVIQKDSVIEEVLKDSVIEETEKKEVTKDASNL